MRRRDPTLLVSITESIHHHQDILTTALSRNRPYPGTDYNNTLRFTEHTVKTVGVANLPLQLELNSVEARSNVVDQENFRMEVSGSFEQPNKANERCNYVLVASDKYQFNGLSTNTPVVSNKCIPISIPFSVFVCLFCLFCDFNEAAPLNYARNRAPAYRWRQQNVLMPPLDLGFRGQTSSELLANSNQDSQPSHHNSYWHQERAYLYPDTEDIAPGTLMSLTSGYNDNRPPGSHSLQDSNHRHPYNQVVPHVPANYAPVYPRANGDFERSLQLPQQPGPKQTYDLMQNDPVYTDDERYNHVGRILPQQAQYPNPSAIRGGQQNTFYDQYSRWQPQPPYGQPNGYHGNVYGMPTRALTYWDEAESSAYLPNTQWNSGYHYQPTWLALGPPAPRWRVPPSYALPRWTPHQQQTPPLSPPYGPAHGNPSNYAVISEEQLAKRKVAFEQNAQRAGIQQGANVDRQLTDGLQLPPLETDSTELDGTATNDVNNRVKDKGMTLSGSVEHDDIVRNFNRLAATHSGSNRVELLFKDIDLNNDKKITMEELKKFLQLHEVYIHD